MQELIDYIDALLGCAELNQCEIEPETAELIHTGVGYVERYRKEHHKEE